MRIFRAGVTLSHIETKHSQEMNEKRKKEMKERLRKRRIGTVVVLRKVSELKYGVTLGGPQKHAET